MIIETRPGAEGIIASEAVRKAAPDGYTLYYGTATGMSFAPAAKKVPPYDPVNDFTPISLVGIFGFFVFSHASLPVNTIGDLIGYARANPGKLNYGTGNATSILATGAVRGAAEARHGAHPLQGRRPAVAGPDRRAREFRHRHARHAGAAGEGGQAARARDAAAEPQPLLPDAPTMSEAGLRRRADHALGRPVRAAEDAEGDRRSRRARDGRGAGQARGASEAFGKLAFEPRSSTPQELSAFVAEQLEAYRRAARAVDLSLD